MSAPTTAHTVVPPVGDGTTPAAGHPHLTLTRPASDAAQRSLDWLSASARAAPLVGRTQEMTELEELLLGDPRPLLVQVMTGSMGRGKTRLAMELIDWASAQGWSAGFAQNTELARFLAQPDLQGWAWHTPTLVVIDNAAQHTQALSHWLQILSQRPEGATAPPLRLLLLERQANLQHGWLALMLAGTSHVASRKRALLEPPEPVELPPLSSDEDCLALLAGLKARLSPGEPPPDNAPARALLRALRTGQQDCDPLHLMMAALTYEQSGVVALRRARLATGLARGEAQRITDLALAGGIETRLVLHLVACVTLTQGLTRTALAELAVKEAQALELSCDPMAAAAFVADQLPGPGGGIAPLMPELIGEAFVLAQELPSKTVLACYQLAPGAVTRTAVRCAEDLRSLGGTLPLTWLAAILEDRQGDEQGLFGLAAAMSPDSHVLGAPNLQVAKEWLRLRVEASASSTALAAALQHLARAHGRAGEPQEALTAARRAAGLYEEAARASDEARLDAAAPLSHLAALLEELGALPEAAAVSQQVVTLYRELESKQPGSFTRELSEALYGLATRLGAHGATPAAIEAAQEARLLLQGLAGPGPGHPWAPPALARCILTLARLMREQQRPPAIEATREAVELLRALATRRPGAFGATLAEALTVLASLLASELKHSEGVTAAQEAILMYRELSASRPYPFAPRLAEALMVLAGVLGSQQHPESALQAAQEAALLNRELATFRPGLRAPLAASLRCVATLLQQLRRHYGAILAQEEAVQLYRDLTTPATDGRIDLATSLTHLARMQSEQGHLEAALATTLEATAVYRELDALRQTIFRSALATSLGSLARLQAEAGQRETAVATAREAIMIRRALAAQRPAAQRPALASALAYLSSLLKGLGLRDAALPVAWEVTELYRALAAERPAAFQPQLAAALDTLCDLLTGNDEWQAALDLASESLAVRRALAAARPAMFRGELAELLARLARIHHALGDSGNALESVRQALNLYAELAAAQPAAFRPGLAAAQNTLALLLADAGRREEALAAAEEALAAYRELGEQHPGMFQEALASALDVLATVRGPSLAAQEAT